MKLIHDGYNQSITNDKFADDPSLVSVPLLLLNNYNKDGKMALELALKGKKPQNFEMMIDMVKDFEDMCLSKQMLVCLPYMVKEGLSQILQYFD